MNVILTEKEFEHLVASLILDVEASTNSRKGLDKKQCTEYMRITLSDYIEIENDDDAEDCRLQSSDDLSY